MSTALHAKKFFVGAIVLTIAIGAYLFITTPKAQALESLDSIAAGDLIRGESFAAVYYMGADGFRYVFPNSKTYDTWYENFDDVKFIADSDLGSLQIGGNVTYRPGVRMIKIESDPSTYAVSKGGVLQHVGSESIATDLYGSSWNTMIDDVPDGFFTNYSIGDEITDSSDYNASDATAATTTINSDHNLVAPAEISMTDSGFSPIDVTIEAGGSVRFTNNGSSNHSVTGEDLSWGSGTMVPGKEYVQTFEEAGTYTFFDSYDSGNTGAIYVE